MERVWDKIDGYTKSDHLESSDDAEEPRDVSRQTRFPSTSTENSLPTEAEEESSTEDVDVVRSGSLHDNLLNEMRKSELHCNTKERNIQEKINDISAEKRRQKEELTEMHHKAQVISKSARMSAADVLSTIVNSETRNNEENDLMEEYYNKIRSAGTEGSEVAPEKDHDRRSSLSDLDLPEIPSPSTAVLNTGVMKSKANVARQGSMKARRKPTTAKRKSWTPGITELNLREQDETAGDIEETGGSYTWVLSQPKAEEGSQEEALHRSGSFTPSDSSSDEDKEAIKPHLRSGVALPGLGDALKIQIQRSELKQTWQTAYHLVRNAKDAKENEVSKEDKAEVAPSKPDWMKEVELRKKNPRPPRRKHMTLPGRCSELDKLFEQRKNAKSSEALAMDVDLANEEEGSIARESPRPKGFPDQGLDPELSKLFEKRKNLKPMEAGPQVMVRPKSLHLEDTKASELDKVFEKRKSLKPVKAINTDAEQSRVEPPGTVSPRRFPGDSQASEIVRARFHDSSTKLEPLPFTSTGQVKVKVKVATTLKDDTRFSPATSGQSHSGQAGAQVAQFVFDGKGANRAVRGCIPPTGGQKSSGGLFDQTSNNRAVSPVTARYSETNRCRSNQGANSRESGANVGYPAKEPCLNQGIPNENHVSLVSPKSPKSDTYSFIEQLSVRSGSGSTQDKSLGKSRVKHTPSRESTSKPLSLNFTSDIEPDRPLYSNTMHNGNNGHGISRNLYPGNPHPPSKTDSSVPMFNCHPPLPPQPRNEESKSPKLKPCELRPQEHRTQEPKLQELKPRLRKPQELTQESKTDKIRYQKPKVCELRPPEVKTQESRTHNKVISEEPKSKELRPQEVRPAQFRTQELNTPELRTLPSRIRTVRSHETKPQTPRSQDRNLPPLILDRGVPPSRAKSPLSSSPKRQYPQQSNGRLHTSTSQESGIVSPKCDQLRTVGSPVESNLGDYHKFNSSVMADNKHQSNRPVENGLSRVKSPVGAYPYTGPDADLERQYVKPATPVTVTVKSITEPSVRVKVRENGASVAKGGVLPHLFNGEVSKKDEEMDGLVTGQSDPQSAEHTAAAKVTPKWKQELREKKRLQRERQGEVLNKQKDDVKPEQSGNDMTMWQKRLEGIRKTWGKNEDSTDKDDSDNLREQVTSDQNGEEQKEVPGFLKEFKEKKAKQKVKVTVTAKTTPNQQDAERVSLDKDKESSSKLELGTYV